MSMASWHTLFVPMAFGGVAGLVGGLFMIEQRRDGLGIGAIGLLVFFALGGMLLSNFAVAAIANPSLEGPGGRGTPILPLAKFAFGQIVFTVPAVALGVMLWRVYRRAVPRAA